MNHVSEPAQAFPKGMTRDVEHLNLLAIFHFIIAGLAGVGFLFVIAHFVMFSMTVGSFSPSSELGDTYSSLSPKFYINLIKVLYFFAVIWLMALAELNLLSGLYLRERKRRNFSLFVAGINLLHFPLGTVLGVFTLMTLMRESMRKLYEEKR